MDLREFQLECLAERNPRQYSIKRQQQQQQQQQLLNISVYFTTAI